MIKISALALRSHFQPEQLINVFEAAAQIHIINDITALFKAGEVIVEYGHQYLIFGCQQDKMDAPLFPPFFLGNSLCVCVVVFMCSTVCVSDSAPLGSARNLTQGESDRTTQKVGEKQHTSCALSHFVLLLLSRLAGQREGGGVGVRGRERTRLDGGGGGGDEITPVLVAD